MNCANCGTLLEEVEPQHQRRKSDIKNYSEALRMTLSGGWGMGYDGPVLTFILCEDCTDEFTNVYPWAKKALEE